MTAMLEDLAERFRRTAPSAHGWMLRLVEERSQRLMVRQDVLEPPQLERQRGAMITVFEGTGSGYAATSDLSDGGLSEAFQRALSWAHWSAGKLIANALPQQPLAGSFRSPVRTGWTATSLSDIKGRLHDACRRLARGPAIVDRVASFSLNETDSVIASSAGGCITQSVSLAVPYLAATANQQSQSQTRSFGRDAGRQGGLEFLQTLTDEQRPEQVADEALQLLAAPDCPAENMEVILMPSQMVLQIHESIGHPLELDRILGDERNMAGTSFVQLDMFGSYRYGSDLLNITFDPERQGEFASYSFDDEGTRAQRVFLIKDGILLRGLGGALSQSRSGVPGTANARACSWNRPPIDRMANINLEGGTSTLANLIKGTRHGILMDSNRSWSIDDSRNKFQFGCEYARMIVDGELRGIVKNPNYRGISATFWRNLNGVGNNVELGGTPNCGKGEPHQVIHVGHATPACRFSDVAVFGGGA